MEGRFTVKYAVLSYFKMVEDVVIYFETAYILSFK